MIQSITVSGMTCANCVRHVTVALQGVPGVLRAEVDLPSGTARLETDRDVAPSALSAALNEEGYALG